MPVYLCWTYWCVYTSRLRMRLPHCIAFFYYLPWYVDVYGKKIYYFVNAMHCGKRMRKSDVATRLYWRTTQSVQHKNWVYFLVVCTGKVGQSFVGEMIAPNSVRGHTCALHKLVGEIYPRNNFYYTNNISKFKSKLCQKRSRSHKDLCYFWEM